MSSDLNRSWPRLNPSLLNAIIILCKSQHESWGAILSSASCPGSLARTVLVPSGTSTVSIGLAAQRGKGMSPWTKQLPTVGPNHPNPFRGARLPLVTHDHRPCQFTLAGTTSFPIAEARILGRRYVYGSESSASLHHSGLVQGERDRKSK